MCSDESAWTFRLKRRRSASLVTPVIRPFPARRFAPRNPSYLPQQYSDDPVHHTGGAKLVQHERVREAGVVVLLLGRQLESEEVLVVVFIVRPELGREEVVLAVVDLVGRVLFVQVADSASRGRSPRRRGRS